MAHFTAGVALAVVVMVTADPTLRPSTPPTQRPTAPSPRPTSSTPQPTDLIRTSSGDYYLYVYAQRRTSVSFLVTAAKSSCGSNNKAEKVSLTLLAILLPIAFCIAIIVCVAYCGWATWENCKPSNHRPTEYPSEAPEGYGQEPVFDPPATGQLDQPVSACYGHGVPTATPVASAPPVEQSSGWTWSKATPAQQANRFNMCL